MNRSVASLVSFLAACAVAPPLHSTAQITNDDWVSMGASAGPNFAVEALAKDPSGNLYVGGRFSRIGDFQVRSIGKWDGETWFSMDSGLVPAQTLASGVRSLLFSGGELYASGVFKFYPGLADQSTNAKAWRYMAHWDKGAKAWRPLGTGVEGKVSAMAADGTHLYVAGNYVTGKPHDDSSDADVHYLAEWGGEQWSSVPSGFNGRILALAVLDGDLYAGGKFTKVGDVDANWIARWDGKQWSPLGDELRAGTTDFIGNSDQFGVFALASRENELVVSGRFEQAGEIATSNIARWNGVAWRELGAGLNDQVRALEATEDAVYAAGRFTMAGDQWANGIAKWNGSQWEPLGAGISSWRVSMAEIDGRLYVGGRFRIGENLSYLAKWQDGTWSSVDDSGTGAVFHSTHTGGCGAQDAVADLVAMDSDVYAAGTFRLLSGESEISTGIAHWDGADWSPVESPVGHTPQRLFTNGTNLFAIGYFGREGAAISDTADSWDIAKWDGRKWTFLGSRLFGSVSALAWYEDRLHVAGRLSVDASHDSGTEAYYLLRLDDDGWTPLARKLANTKRYTAEIADLEVFQGELYAGGAFITIDGIAANQIAKWNGERWASVGNGVTDYVRDLASTADSLYVSGNFANGEAVAKWDGIHWDLLAPIEDAELIPHKNQLYAASWRQVHRWNGLAWEAMGSGIRGGAEGGFGTIISRIGAMAVYRDQLFVGGLFDEIGGRATSNIGRVFLEGTPPVEIIHGQATVFFRGLQSGRYQIERSNGLQDWEPIDRRYAGTTGAIDLVDRSLDASANGQMFYRAVKMHR